MLIKKNVLNALLYIYSKKKKKIKKEIKQN